MPLPAVSDSLLLKELAVVVTAGWQLPLLPQRAGDVKLLLESVSLRSRAGAFRQLAHDLLQMLDDALLSCSEDDAEESLLTAEQATGLRILFGTHPSYRDATASIRRDNAAEYLGESRRGGSTVRGDTLYRRRQRELLQLALDCLRRRYGQDPPGTPHLTEIETVSAILNFNELGLIDNVVYNYRVRARRHVVGKLYARTELPAGADPKAEIAPLTNIIFRHVRQWIPGHLSVSFLPPEQLTLGQRLNYGFRITYGYPGITQRPERGHFMHWEHNDYYRLIVHCEFGTAPAACWSFQEPLLHYPGSEKRNRLLSVDGEGYARFDTAATACRMAHGLAWRW
jgi:hypothetical protein